MCSKTDVGFRRVGRRRSFWFVGTLYLARSEPAFLRSPLLAAADADGRLVVANVRKIHAPLILTCNLHPSTLNGSTEQRCSGLRDCAALKFKTVVLRLDCRTEQESIAICQSRRRLHRAPRRSSVICSGHGEDSIKLPNDAESEVSGGKRNADTTKWRRGTAGIGIAFISSGQQLTRAREIGQRRHAA